MALRGLSLRVRSRPADSGWGCVVYVLLAAACGGGPDEPVGTADMPGFEPASIPPPARTWSDAGRVVEAPVVDAAVSAPDAVSDATEEPLPPLHDAYEGPTWLSETGLYTEIVSDTLAEGVREYRPQGELWTDGADKRRFLWLPPGATIDTGDMDQWVLPIGTKLWKEFSRDGLRIETRLLEKHVDGTWLMVAFLWRADGSDAAAAPLGVVDAMGTEHDVPDEETCRQCHDGRRDRVLGVGALQLAHDGDGMTLRSLITEGRLSQAPQTMPALPGDGETQAALRYLHANCGHCHNPTRTRAEREISVYFWQEVDALGQLEDTVTYRSLVQDKPSPLWIDAVVARMRDRGGLQQMPPVGTEHVDEEGVAVVSALMELLRTDRPDPPSTATSGPCPGTEAVFEIFERAACRNAFCHGAGTGELSFRTPEELHDSLVGVAAIGEGCDSLGLKRVAPGDPQHSLLLIKLQPGPPCGKIMPPAMSLTDAEIRTVEDWIVSCQ